MLSRVSFRIARDQEGVLLMLKRSEDGAEVTIALSMTDWSFAVAGKGLVYGEMEGPDDDASGVGA